MNEDSKFFCSVATNSPILVAEWSDLNEKKSYEIRYGSHRIAHWKCGECGYEWDAPVYSRTICKHGCPKCAGKVCDVENSFAVKYPELCNCLKNKNMNDVWHISFDSNSKLNFVCPYCGKEFVSTPHHMVRKPICPNCNAALMVKENSIGKNFPLLSKSWDYDKNSNDKIPEVVTCKSNQICYFKCRICGSSVPLAPYKILRDRVVLCSKCKNKRDTAFRKACIQYYIQNYYKDVMLNYRGEQYVIDAKIDSYGYAIKYIDDSFAKGYLLKLKKMLGEKLYTLSEVNTRCTMSIPPAVSQSVHY